MDISEPMVHYWQSFNSISVWFIFSRFYESYSNMPNETWNGKQIQKIFPFHKYTNWFQIKYTYTPITFLFNTMCYLLGVFLIISCSSSHTRPKHFHLKKVIIKPTKSMFSHQHGVSYHWFVFLTSDEFCFTWCDGPSCQPVGFFPYSFLFIRYMDFDGVSTKDEIHSLLYRVPLG
jgi:hypothetical protein